MTLCPCNFNRLANLPIVVVLPAPFTPTTKMTKGLSCFGILRLISHGFKISIKASFKACSNTSRSFNSTRLSCSDKRVIIAALASTPTSAINKFASMSANKFSLVDLDKILPNPFRVRCNCDFNRPYSESVSFAMGSLTACVSTSCVVLFDSKTGKSYLL